MILEIDLERFVTKKRFREALGISAGNLNNWINREGKIKTKMFPIVDLELIDLDSIKETTFPWGGGPRDKFYKVDGRWRLKEIRQILKITDFVYWLNKIGDGI